MPLRDAVDQLCAFRHRAACSDAERRAATFLHDDLRARGHEAWLETVWVRPQWAWSALLHAALAVVASLLTVAQPVVAVVLAAVVLVSYALEAAGLGGLLARLFYRRATQLVLVEPADPDAITLVITANTDAPRRGLVFRDGWRRLGRRLVPGPSLWLLILLGAVLAAAIARLAGAEGNVLGAVQLVPTVGLLLVATAAIDIALSEVSPGAGDNAAGVAVAMALHDELARHPPERLSPALWLAGAGEAFPFALRAHLRRERPAAADTVVIEIGPCGAGAPAWDARHPQLVAAAEVAGETRVRLRRPTGAGAARARGLPAVHVRALDEHGIVPRSRTPADVPENVDQMAMDAVLDWCLLLVDELDEQLSLLSASP